ncbi:hypothetical protein O9Z70_06545 [Devosia sp. YIM 151766]|uniref:hypothetical protein n=1 Tax=Devosia sp. YIM 151766 TaxID=3017325 RepID=UPI00255D121F|nr:hypothetical protein [Devosia sp. YIM 151766]WIY54176.1 hypothetical protein O9Z70_06545 [Devosia sp. YIM 151766]
MSRVPNTESVEQEAQRFLDQFDGYVYAWSADPEAVVDDAIIVGIGGTSAEMLMAGLPYAEPAASIYWPARSPANGAFGVGSEMGPWSVMEALRRAHFLRQRMDYERVVVTLEEAGIWRPEYGRLADQEGY